MPEGQRKLVRSSQLTLKFRLGGGSAGSLAFAVLCGGVILIYLVRTRHHPTSRRALLSVFVLFVLASIAIIHNQWWLSRLGRPYTPFLGHELMMVTLGLTLATRFTLGVGLIVLTAANAIVLWFLLDLAAQQHLIPLASPWVMLSVMVIGLVSLRMLEQRQITSLQLLRARATALAMQRQTLMFLALRDRLNSPLQTLVLGAGGPSSSVVDGDADRMQAAIDRLVALSRELAAIDVDAAESGLSLDAEHQLRRHHVHLTDRGHSS